jgi:hypothetical protein
VVRESTPRDLERLPFGARVKDPLGRVRSLFDGENFEHVGDSVSFTQDRGSIVANHDMKTYLTALGVDIKTPLAQTAAASGS